MVDLDALEAAGIKNAHDRAPLLDYLDSLGFTAEEMIAAEQEDRLFGLAGDALMRSGRPQYSLHDAARHLALPIEDVEHAWAVLGLTAASSEAVLLTPADLDGLKTWAEMRALIGSEAALGSLRVIGSSLARIAEAGSAAMRAAVPDIQLNYSPDELTTAQTFRAVASYVPRIGALMDAAYRHHLSSARLYFEGVVQDASSSVVSGVGFVDLSGFTSLTEQLQPDELSMLLNEFSSTVTDVVHADGGRIVKFIGDAVMWVSSTPQALVRAALDLVDHPKAMNAGLQVRGGIAYGSMIAANGDFFGNPVNLAARLVAAAEPGQILASAGLHEALPLWPAEELEPLTLKGFASRQPAFLLGHKR